MELTIEEVIELSTLRSAFESSETTDEARVEILKRVQEIAEHSIGYDKKCVNCHKTIIGIDYHKALIEGHVYSMAGTREYEISQLCEFCFDNVTTLTDATLEQQTEDEN